MDLDDTILSINASVEKCWRDVSARFVERHSAITLDSLMSAIDAAREWYWSDLERHRLGRLTLDRARRDVVEIALARLGLLGDGLAADLADSYGKEIEKHTHPFPGAIEAIQRLRHKKVRLALVTNGSPEIQRRKIGRFELEPLFDYIIVEGEFGHGKPDERIFQHALSTLNLDARDAWMVGDDLYRDIAGAQQVGLFSIWVDWQGKGLPESSGVRPDRIVRSIAELVH